jgi:hypothetical protein
MQLEGRIFLDSIERQKVIESQHYCRWKKTGISARIKLAGILGKRVPVFGDSIFPATTPLLLMEAVIEYFQMALASRKSLWWLLQLTSSLMDKVGIKKRPA